MCWWNKEVKKEDSQKGPRRHVLVEQGGEESNSKKEAKKTYKKLGKNGSEENNICQINKNKRNRTKKVVLKAIRRKAEKEIENLCENQIMSKCL